MTKKKSVDNSGTEEVKKKPAKAKPAETKAPKKPAKGDKKEKVPAYKGIMGYLAPKQKQAVDELLDVIEKCLGKRVANAEVSVYGSYARMTPTRPTAGKTYHDVWTISEISYVLPGPREGSVAGVSWTRSDAESLGICAAAEDVLATYGVKPIKSKHSGEEVVFDDHADAIFRLEFLFKLPSADKLRRNVYFLLWQEKKRPGISLIEALHSRFHGYYGEPLRKELEEAVNTLGVKGRDRLDAQLEKNQAIKPARVFELCFVGYDPDVKDTWHLCKTVQASPALMQTWMTRNGIVDYLQENAIDLAQQAETEAEKERILRGQLGDAIDLIIGGTPENMTFTQPDLTLATDHDPAEDWKNETRQAVCKVENSGESADQKQTAKGFDPESDRVKRELEVAGIADYRGRNIQLHPTSGYTLTGHDQYPTVEDAMRACDETLARSQSRHDAEDEE